MLLQKITAIHQHYRKDRLTGSMCQFVGIQYTVTFVILYFTLFLHGKIEITLYFFLSPQSWHIMMSKSTSLRSEYVALTMDLCVHPSAVLLTAPVKVLF